MNAVLANLPAITECLSTINTPVAVGVKAKLCKFSSVYLLFVFRSPLSVTAGLHRYLQKETIDLVQAVAYKNAVTDSLKEKRSDASVSEPTCIQRPETKVVLSLSRQNVKCQN